MNNNFFINFLSIKFFKKIIYIVPRYLRLNFFLTTLLMIFLSLLELLILAFIVPLIGEFVNSSSSSGGYILNFLSQFLVIDLFLLNNNQKLFFLLSIFFSLFILKCIMGLYAVHFKYAFIFKVTESAGNNLFWNYINQKYNFFLKNNSSILIRNIQSEVISFSRILYCIITIFQDITLLILIISFLFFFDIKSTSIIVFCVSITALIFIFFFKNKLKTWSLLRIKYEGLKIKKIQESFQGIKDVKLFNSEEFFYKQFSSYNYNTLQNIKNERVLGETPKIIFEILLILAIVIVTMLYLAKGYTTIQTIAYLSIFFFSSIRIIPAINRIVISIQSLKYCAPSVEIIYKELKKTPNQLFYYNSEKKNSHNPTTIFKNKIKLKNISFKYQNNKSYILKNLNLEIKKGDFIGIYGESGSGKTTLLNILTGLLFPSSGEIELDDIKLTKNSNILMNLISYVPQNFYLLDESIKKNIIMNKRNYLVDTPKLLSKVLNQSRINNFINKLPQGINTRVGEGSSRISGGQKQRLAIARALFKNSDILIMDEPTSSLDNSTEDKLVKEINQLSKFLTTIIISHNLKALKNCNKIYELKNKKLVKIIL